MRISKNTRLLVQQLISLFCWCRRDLPTIPQGLTGRRSLLARPYISHRRKSLAPELLRPVKRDRLEDFSLQAAVLSFPCCEAECVRQFSPQDVHQRWQQNATFTEQEVLTWIMGLLRDHCASKAVDYVIKSIPVCRTAFRLLHGISDWKLRRAIDAVRLGLPSAPPHDKKISESPKRAWVKGFFLEWLQQECDPIVDGHFVLPAYLHWLDIWKDCFKAWQADLEHGKSGDDKTTSPSVQPLRSVLRTDFPHVSVSCLHQSLLVHTHTLVVLEGSCSEAWRMGTVSSLCFPNRNGSQAVTGCRATRASSR